jgi:hypothetical protein
MKATAGRIGILGQSSTPNYSLINVLEIGAWLILIKWQ